ncbi:MAG: patatin-like phospholipase family protein [Clostridia bacterium]|nr:patatin-like phospholipase family protein [Clostridia bacterium]
MKKILSIDGGGIKGIFAASFLAQIEQKNHIKICDYFDLIAGTSTGGIIAAGLACGVPAQRILEIYIKKGEKIFPQQKRFAVFKTKYDSKTLESELVEIFKDIFIRDCLTRLVIPAFNISENRTRVFKTPHAPDLYYDKNVKLVDCILATTAAPLYFKPHAMNGGVFIDGGVGANNPSLIALVEGISRLNWSLKDIAMLSIAGTSELGPNNGKESMGLIDALKIQKSFMCAESQYSHNICKILLDSQKYLRIENIVQHGKFGLDKANSQLMTELRNLGETEAMRHMSQIEKLFLNEEIDKIDFFI